jgi:gamma-glutamylcyclotransferase
VYGLLYEITPENEIALDAYEGYPVSYEKEIADIKVVSADESESTVKAIVYMDKREKEGVPKEEYIKRMNYAIADALVEGVPNEYIQTYLRRFIPITTDLN